MSNILATDMKLSRSKVQDKIIQSSVKKKSFREFTRIGDFTWGLSDCDELVGSVTEDDGVGFREFLTVPLHSPTFQ